MELLKRDKYPVWSLSKNHLCELIKGQAGHGTLLSPESYRELFAGQLSGVPLISVGFDRQAILALIEAESLSRTLVGIPDLSQS